ncbi:hypothetical protein HPB50_020412 [Hyalomma asiaticum]|uniref:Uncharacterized protein n=1 Tax=Hyalomma asiaticum TaxID=266040 RepID=A0ACB7TRY3_HYAAI|nr:hypothetical protein HPB50_020412 [Hyalomma asiaticum]
MAGPEDQATRAPAQGSTPNKELPSLNICNLISFGHEEPTDEFLLRAGCNIREVDLYGAHGMFSSTENTAEIHAPTFRATGTLNEGGFFHFLMKCPLDCPYGPTQVVLMSTDTGRGWFVSNICDNGKVCLGFLGTSSGPACGAGQFMRSGLWSVKPLLTAENPMAQRSTPSSSYVGKMYGENWKAVKNVHLNGSRLNDSKEAGVPTHPFDVLLEERFKELRYEIVQCSMQKLQQKEQAPQQPSQYQLHLKQKANTITNALMFERLQL